MPKLYANVVTLAVALGSFTYGFTFGAPSVCLALEGFLTYFNVTGVGSNASYAASMQGAIVGVFFAGGFFGAFGGAWLADGIGRKRALDVVLVISVIATIISTASVHISMLLVGRILQGVGGGGINVIVPMFQSEISVAEHRGRNVGFHGCMFVTGLSTVNWLAFGTYFMKNEQLAWRLVLGLQAVSPIILLSIRFWLPESPRWLELKGREQEAFDCLCKLHDEPGDTTHALATTEHNLIRKQIAIDAKHDASWSALFARPSTRRRLVLGVFVMFMQQSTGQNVLYGFQVNTLTTLGLTGWQPSLVVSFYVTLAATLNYVGGFFMDRIGRRTMMLGALACTIVFTSIHTALVITYGGGANKAGAGAAVAFLFLFITAFAPGIDVTSYVYGAEIFPNYMRARGLAITIGAYFAFAAVYVNSATKASSTIGAYYNIIFISLSAINWVIGYKIMPETKGLTLEEMGTLFGEEDEVAHLEQDSPGEKNSAHNVIVQSA